LAISLFLFLMQDNRLERFFVDFWKGIGCNPHKL
jgi:hypothetical protein